MEESSGECLFAVEELEDSTAMLRTVTEFPTKGQCAELHASTQSSFTYDIC